MSSTADDGASSSVETRCALNSRRARRGRSPSCRSPGSVCDQRGQRGVREPVPVGGQERFVVAEVRRDRLQPLADRRVEAGVDEGDPPVLEVAREQLELRAVAVALEHEVVEERLVVGEEVLLDDLALVAEAEDEVVVTPARVVAHDVPEDRPAADLDHRLRDALRRLAHANAEAAAEDHDLHGRPDLRLGSRCSQ